MNAALRLAERRAALTARSQAQRRVLAEQLRSLQGPARSIDRGLRLVKLVRSHPLLAALAVVVVLLYKPRRTLRWVGRAVTLYSFARRLGAAFARR